jgi:hypothetical protein
MGRLLRTGFRQLSPLSILLRRIFYTESRVAYSIAASLASPEHIQTGDGK